MGIVDKEGEMQRDDDEMHYVWGLVRWELFLLLAAAALGVLYRLVK